jgi:hypothetical protein
MWGDAQNFDPRAVRSKSALQRPRSPEAVKGHFPDQIWRAVEKRNLAVNCVAHGRPPIMKRGLAAQIEKVHA